MSCGDKPRACIAYKNIELCYCSFLSSRDVVTCIGKWSGMDIYLVSAYFDGTVDKIPDALTKTLETVAKRGAELILCVDANAHLTAWASKSTDRRGRMVEFMMSSYGLQLANQGDKFTYDCSTGRSIIDLTLGTMRVIQTIQGWQVEEHKSYSDHKRITFDLPGFKRPRFEAKWIVDKADWPRFRSIMTKAFDQWRRPVYWTPYMVDKEADDLNRDVTQCPRR